MKDGAAGRTAENAGRLHGGDFRNLPALDFRFRSVIHLIEFAPARATPDNSLAPIEDSGRLGCKGLPGLAILLVRDGPFLRTADVRRLDRRETREVQVDELRPALVRQVGRAPGQDQKVARSGRGHVPEAYTLAPLLLFRASLDIGMAGWAGAEDRD